jgi:hypothetical protein
VEALQGTYRRKRHADGLDPGDMLGVHRLPIDAVSPLLDTFHSRHPSLRVEIIMRDHSPNIL